MKILNENEIIIGNTIYEFNESDDEFPCCNLCSFDLKHVKHLSGLCEKVPCNADSRSDNKNGWFGAKCKIIKT